MGRPLTVQGTTYKMVTGCGNMYVTINRLDDDMYEVFARLGKAGGCSSSQTEAIGRLVSLLLKNKIDPNNIVKHLHGITCQATAWAENGEHIGSCADAIAKAMKEDIARNSKQEVYIPQENTGQEICPECQSEMQRIEGCLSCMYCNYSKC